MKKILLSMFCVLAMAIPAAAEDFARFYGEVVYGPTGNPLPYQTVHFQFRYTDSNGAPQTNNQWVTSNQNGHLYVGFTPPSQQVNSAVYLYTMDAAPYEVVSSYALASWQYQDSHGVEDFVACWGGGS